jgi:hypothetical protein
MGAIALLTVADLVEEYERKVAEADRVVSQFKDAVTAPPIMRTMIASGRGDLPQTCPRCTQYRQRALVSHASSF